MRHLRTLVTAAVTLAVISTATLALPTPASAADTAATEASFVDLINAERHTLGLAPLTVDADLVTGARTQAAVIRDAGYLVHSTDLGSVTTGWAWLGENIGVGPTPRLLHDAFMTSPSHRANIVKADATHIGTGVAMEGSTIWVTVMFMRTDRTAAAFTPPFTDDDGSPYEPSIIAIADAGITDGCGTDLYCPYALVTRAEMATFLVRAFNLPAASTNAFVDDNTNQHQASINALAAAGVTKGCATDTFCPNSTVTRGELATFIMRAAALAPASTDHFNDDNGSVHEPGINAVAAAGIAGGCQPSKFCPNTSVSREQMAGFLANSLDI